MTDYEKLGSFYLGKAYDLESRKRLDDLILYDSKDLCTHAVCVGMTGSGKTGLCIDLLEEAAIDSIPAIVIDPKGDLSNLLLTFPNLQPQDFQPWVNADDAVKKGLTPEQFAQQQASLWSKGLAEWGQDGSRIQRLKDAAEFTIYTPGSSAGVPVSVLKSFDAPPPAILDDPELFRERINSTATSLLGLLGIDADPIRSREHILLSTILNRAWSEGGNLDLGSLIAQIQKPPVQRIGVLELESFFPSKDRFDLAMQLNNLLASPGFSAWTDGDPLDIGAILATPKGKPRIAIFSIAHLSDAERMFFVSLLLSQTLGWVRTQTGTSSLRAILYMDEIAGYFPPTANPPSKQPLLTLMKQGRAFGFGVVLATQNPVDLDYKGLSNAGTWFIGRLQTERDKARVLDGLEGASAQASSTFDRSAVDKALSALGNRVFLMNNVHDDGPVIIESRWALSYLRGPLTRQQIKSLSTGGAPGGTGLRPVSEPQQAPLPQQSQPQPAAPASSASRAPSSSRPVLPSDIPQYFLPLRGTTQPGATLTYQPMLLGSAKIFYSDTKAGVDLDQPVSLLAQIQSGPMPVDWETAAPTDLTESDIDHDPTDNSAAFAALPTDATKAKSFDAWKKSFADTLFRTQKLEILACDPLDTTSNPGESERDFRLRLQHLAREQRDAFAEKLRAKYASRIATLQDRLRRAQQAVEVQAEQARSAKVGTALSFGTAILSAFLGKKTLSAGNVSRAGSAVRGVSRSAKESADVGRASENVQAVQQQLDDLTNQIQQEVEEANSRIDPLTVELRDLSIKPKKTAISVRAVVLAWAPTWVSPTGASTPAW